jgi:hypothetical protein
VSEPISILDVIKRGGYEASLITTFNATLPFYEEVILRKLVGAGCRHNVVLMDRSQCAISWASEATRPRLAGHAYTLLPIGATGAFHPKLCILVGPKKASILIGSHNLTLSGFGYNREVTNWIEVAGAKDGEGAALLADAWRMASQWIEMERGKSADVLLEAALALSNFIGPLVINAKSPSNVFTLMHSPSGTPLIDQISERISPNVKRIGVIGAFFDKELALVTELARRWQKAEVVVGIDPKSVQLFGTPTPGVARYVDARDLWPKSQSYLHAKAIYFDAGNDGSAFVSGSANPSRPAWMGQVASCNVEAVLLRIGPDAHEAAEATGLAGLFDLAELAPSLFDEIKVRSIAETTSSESAPVPLWTGVASHDSAEIRISTRGSKVSIDCALLFGGDLQLLGEILQPQALSDELIIRPGDDAARIRSCALYSQDVLVARAMIHHPSVISTSSQSTRQYQIRSALSGLGSSEGDISTVIASVERVIFSDETHKEIETILREHKDKQPNPSSGPGPETLAVSISDLPKEKKKLRLLKSGDLAYLLDVLLRRISEGLDGTPLETDSSGRNEEEQVGKEGDEEPKPPEPMLPPTRLGDLEIAQAVSRRARALTRRMVEQLQLATADASRRASAVLQLIAVIALVRELRHLDKLPRWKKTGQLLVEERDRRHLLDESLKHLLGSAVRMLDEIDYATDADTDEGMQLRVLLLWLAWDLGEELTEQIGRIWEPKELEAKLRGNAAFLKLMPPISRDNAARAELEQSIARTVRPTPEAALRAGNWLERHLRFGDEWGNGFSESPALRVGGYCYVPGKINEPRVVLEVSGDVVGFWDYDRVWRFARDRVLGVLPLHANAVFSDKNKDNHAGGYRR